MQEKKHKHKFQGSTKNIFCVIEHILHGSFMTYAYQTEFSPEKNKNSSFSFCDSTPQKEKKPSWQWNTKFLVNLQFSGPITNKVRKIMIFTHNTYNSILIIFVKTENHYFFIEKKVRVT